MHTETVTLRGTTAVVLGAVLALGTTSCIASNVVAVEDREVVEATEAVDWSGDPEALLADGGLFESLRIEGDAAAQLAKIYYMFEPGGRHSAAALMYDPDDGEPRFRTLEGTWELRDGALVLDGGDPVPVRASAQGQLELSAPGGRVVLRKVATP